MTHTNRYAFFVTPHGFGHAGRASAVMSAILARQPDAFFEIFTRVPDWFFHMSLNHAAAGASPYRYHDVLTDVGLVQATSMIEDLPATIDRLGELLPYRADALDALAAVLTDTGCRAVLCDIAPLGIAAAHRAGLPALLVENFTWDWIYRGYLDEEPRFAPYIDYLHAAFTAADHHIRALPACTDDPPAGLTVQPVSRKPRAARAETRARLGVPPDAPLVMITMGGILTLYPFLDQIQNHPSMRFLIPGGSAEHEQRGSLVLIPHHSDFYHPDLVEAADVIIGKLGYSTLAEARAAGLPYIYIPRPNFPETEPMSRYAREDMGAVELSEERFLSGDWLDLLPELLARPRTRPETPNGADQIAEYLAVL